MRAIVMAAVLSLMVGGSALAQSKCDSGVTKAAGKKAACKSGVHAKAQKKGTSPDTAKLAKCEDKFDKACNKAKNAGDCGTQTQACSAVEAEVDACVAQFITGGGSPSGAFLD